VTAVDQLLAIATSELGRPYVYGDEGPTSFDCSGLMQYVFAQVGIQLPRTAEAQQKATARVTNPLPGDLVFFGSPAGHVGLYIGGGKMISAPHPGAVVHVTGVGTPTNYGRVSGLGTAYAGTVGLITDTAANAASTVGGWLGGARYIVVEAAFVGLGLALAGYGLYRSVGRSKGATNG
jgi:hypothetical protein